MNDAEIANVRRALEAILPDYLPTRRWFGDKARAITKVRIAAEAPIDGVGLPAALLIAEIQFSDGEPARYVIPVVVSAEERGDRIATLDRGEGVYDALTEPGFRTWLLDLLSGARIGSTGIEVDALPSSTGALEQARSEPSRVLGVEQSNSSIVYGSTAFIKLFRRLQTGVNPDLELTRFLTAKSGFANVPTYLGSISYAPETGEAAVIAVAQSYVDAVGDGWGYLLDVARAHLGDENGRALIAESREIAGRLGDVTAQLHLSLTADPWTPELASEAIKPADVELWSSDYLRMLDSVVAGVERRLSSLEGRSRELAEAFLSVAPGLRTRTNGFERLLGRTKTRVHGDYHLGQTLRTAGGDFMVIDFEGEPQRSIAERRRKSSPLKDVSGMLRSFGYARGTVQQWLTEASGLLTSDLVAWERAMRQAFLDAYVGTARGANAAFLPATDADLDAAIAAWELDKAVYEVQYELNNRPDWLWIPLSAMMKQGEP